MDKDRGPGDMERRGFFSTLGAGVIGARAAIGAAPPPVQAVDGAAPVKLNLLVNGRRHDLLIEPRSTLLYVLREQLGMTGTKTGCDRGECGACTVLINGVSRYSCMTLALEAAGQEVTTIEGLMRGEDLGQVQQAFVAEDGMQCGYCTPGQVMAAEGLLRTKPNPKPDEVREGMSGNVCRCGAYQNILKSVLRAAETRRSAS
jgi:xanthine dehydrogenase YagT iron-sulfur-binding subunit